MSGVVDVSCGGCPVWWMSGVVDVPFYSWCGGCLVWWMSDVVGVLFYTWCGGCLVWWMVNGKTLPWTRNVLEMCFDLQLCQLVQYFVPTLISASAYIVTRKKGHM